MVYIALARDSRRGKLGGLLQFLAFGTDHILLRILDRTVL